MDAQRIFLEALEAPSRLFWKKKLASAASCAQESSRQHGYPFWERGDPAQISWVVGPDLAVVG